MPDQIYILCQGRTPNERAALAAHDHTKDGEPKGCWYWQYGDETRGPFATRAKAFADAEKNHPDESIG